MRIKNAVSFQSPKSSARPFLLILITSFIFYSTPLFASATMPTGGIKILPSISITTNAADIDPVTEGLQVFNNVAVTYSASVTNLQGGPVTWSWKYIVDNGSETEFLSGVGNAADVKPIVSGTDA